MQLTVTSDVLEALLREARTNHPRECCGILLGKHDAVSAILPAANVHASPRTQFEIDPQALVNAHRAAREDGLQVIGYYHSHPEGPAEPSATDRAMAAGDGSVWAIIGSEGAQLWQSGKDGFQKLSYRVIAA